MRGNLFVTPRSASIPASIEGVMSRGLRLEFRFNDMCIRTTCGRKLDRTRIRWNSEVYIFPLGHDNSSLKIALVEDCWLWDENLASSTIEITSHLDQKKKVVELTTSRNQIVKIDFDIELQAEKPKSAKPLNIPLAMIDLSNGSPQALNSQRGRTQGGTPVSKSFMSPIASRSPPVFDGTPKYNDTGSPKMGTNSPKFERSTQKMATTTSPKSSILLSPARLPKTRSLIFANSFANQ
eukprot:TRINITY_DN24480_c0_g1_i2.p1 TRINITY_DN24480_c0_g1~~TRINITY_DN24480_c0_g1_i2.p1  ORF type:complete len:237 (-),score=35.40 TRINITY_DN24480_c0_g1_i2:173-883(-)